MADCTKSLAEPLGSSRRTRDRLVCQVESACLRLGVGAGPMVVAVSGGPDSVALARALKELQSTLHQRPLILAHLNHQLRGQESDGDEAFVAELADALSDLGTDHIHLVTHRIDVKGQARRAKENLEKMAREARYSWLAQVAKQAGARWIATGHTANDQAETVLHRLLRGTGLRGLRGIAESRPLSGDVRLIRPLLTLTRSEVMNYLQAQGQSSRQDSSNLDFRFTRNRIRHELLPFLEKEYNPAVVKTLCRLARQAEETYRGFETRAGKLLARVELPRAGPLLIFHRQWLSSEPRSLVREMFRLVWAREDWPQAQMGHKEWDRLAAVAFGELVAVDLPDGIRAVRRDRVIQVGPGIRDQ